MTAAEVSTDHNEAVRVAREVLADALTLEPCHVTGMHDPNHTDRHLCGIQKEVLADRVLAALGLTPGDLPHKLHDNCGWCHRIPGDEEHREKLRRVHRWAGVELLPELAALADDAMRPEDPETVYAALTDELLGAPELDAKLTEMGTPLHTGRRGSALRQLEHECRVESMIPPSREPYRYHWRVLSPEEAQRRWQQRVEDGRVVFSVLPRDHWSRMDDIRSRLQRQTTPMPVDQVSGALAHLRHEGHVVAHSFGDSWRPARQ